MSTIAPAARAAYPQVKYRTELDGLRGIAIGLVVLYHVFVGRVSGGVDVFLLLSGYFFLGSQLRYASRPNASLNPWWPVWRTIRRLVPALAVVMTATLIMILAWTPQLFSGEFARQVTASMLYFLNWELIGQEAAYVAASTDTSPLQHLWSMSVQGQFYLFAILFALTFAVLVAYREWTADDVRRVAGPVLLVVTVVSFAWASRFGLVGTPESYYSTFARAWELTLGGLLALYGNRLRLPRRWSGPANALGLVLIVVTGIIIPTSLAFPGPAALIPIGGAVLIILSDGSGRTGTLLRSGWATWLGRIAYSFYLWHWPLLIIATTATGNLTPPVWLGGLVIVASLALAHLTYEAVESPLRQHRRRPTANDTPVAEARASLHTLPGQRRAIGGVVVAVLALGMLAVQPMWNSRMASLSEDVLDPRFYPGARVVQGQDAPSMPAQPDPTIVAGIYPAPGADGCMVFLDQPADHFADVDRDGQPCVYGDADAADTVVIAGGSHAETWTHTLDVLGREHGFRVIPFLRQDCPVVLGPNFGVSDDCATWGELAVQRIIDLSPDAVISTSTRPESPNGYGTDIVPEGYAGFWEALDSEGIPFIGLRDNPWFFTPDAVPDDPNHCMLRYSDGGDIYRDLSNPVDACSIPRSGVYQDSDPAADILDAHPHATAVDTADWFCTDEWCPPVIGNVVVMRDQNHVSNAYAESMAGLVWEHLAPVLGRS